MKLRQILTVLFLAATATTLNVTPALDNPPQDPRACLLMKINPLDQARVGAQEVRLKIRLPREAAHRDPRPQEALVVRRTSTYEKNDRPANSYEKLSRRGLRPLLTPLFD